MSDINVLHELVKDTAKVSLEDHYSKKKVILVEQQSPSPSSITIYNVPENSIIIKADNFAAPVNVFNNMRGECKRADFIIVVDDERDKVILYIEMKAGKGNNPEMIQQLKGAQCFVAYCREIGKSFWEQTDFLEGYAQRFISIVHTSIAKRPTRERSTDQTHDQPERMLKINGRAGLQFQKLK